MSGTDGSVAVMSINDKSGRFVTSPLRQFCVVWSKRCRLKVIAQCRSVRRRSFLRCETYQLGLSLRLVYAELRSLAVWNKNMLMAMWA